MKRLQVSSHVVALTVSAMLIGGAASLIARQGAAPAAPPGAGGAPPAGQAPGGGRGGGRGMQPPVAYDDYTGFTKLWDGSTFTNWDGERDVWSIEDGMLHADTVKTPGQHHIHYVGPDAVMKDFDLKVEFKISATGANGGIQYRSRMLHTVHGGTMADPMGKPTPAGITTMAQAVAAGVTAEPVRGGGAPRAGGPGGAGAPGGRAGAPGGPGAPAAPGAAPAATAPAAPPAAPNPLARCGTAGGPPPAANPAAPITNGNIWQVSGYQFDLDSNNQYTGQLYEGQGRSIVTAPGTLTRLTAERPVCVAVINQNPTSVVKPHQGKDGEWQQVEIIARGNTLVHILNGQVLSVSIDDNPAFRALQGILSLQLEGNGQIWYRNVYIKPLN
ncbi:MAG: DUF1080 domain-containing protein [Acidobacteriota bacterium]